EREAFKAQVDRFEALRSRAKYDPAAVLTELGLGDDDYESAARDLYSRSKAASADPKNREAAVRMQREREQAAELAATRNRLEELETRLTKRDQEAETSRMWQGYMADVSKVANDAAGNAPLMRSALAKNPAKTEQALQDLAVSLWKSSGEWPDQEDIVAVYEKHRRAELEELGIDVSAVIRTAPKKAAPVEPTRASATLGADLGAATPVKPSTAGQTREERRAETLRELEKLEQLQANE
nr:hypothetical protein [Deltaproteobacteria bacterium]